MVKRSICILLMLISISQCAFAQNIVFEEIAAEKNIPLNGVLLKKGEIIKAEKTAKYSVRLFNAMTFEEYICDRVVNQGELPEKIEGLGKFNITEDEFADKYFDAVLKHPETLIKTEYTTIDVDDKTNFVTAITPVYLVDSVAAADEARADMEAGIKEYTDLADKYETNIEKLLVIHDKMVADCKYDVRVLDKSTVNAAPPTVYHALGVLRDKFAVCQGYSQALYIIAKKLGIEMEFCYSEKKNHMWNYVKLDGKWYHMDMTNDDPVEKDENGKTVARTDTRAFHDYFLVSDGGLDEEIHGNDYCRYGGGSYECNDTRYQSEYLFNVMIPFTAERKADGYFHMLANFRNQAYGVNTVVDFKSESLYTGAVIPAICITNGKYIVEENGINVEKEGTNLYLIQYATRDVPTLQPIVKWSNNQIQLLEVQNSFYEDQGPIKLIAPNVEESTLPSFTAFLWDAVNLTPYSVKTAWSQQQ